MYMFYKHKIVNRLQQYGLRTGLAQILRAMVRLVYQVDRHILFVIPEFAAHVFHDPYIIPLTRERLHQATNAAELDKKKVQLLSGFLTEGCRGVCAEIDGKLAGFAWVQFDGEYCFGRTGRMIIPPKYAIIKNLLVFPEFRGRRLAQKLNAACLALIRSGHQPLTFIILENRISIQSFEIHGFQQVLQVKHWRWFRGRWQMHVERLADGLQADELEQALTDGHGGNYMVAKSQGAI